MFLMEGMLSALARLSMTADVWMKKTNGYTDSKDSA